MTSYACQPRFTNLNDSVDDEMREKRTAFKRVSFEWKWISFKGLFSKKKFGIRTLTFRIHVHHPRALRRRPDCEHVTENGARRHASWRAIGKEDRRGSRGKEIGEAIGREEEIKGAQINWMLSFGLPTTQTCFDSGHNFERFQWKLSIRKATYQGNPYMDRKLFRIPTTSKSKW